MNRFVKLLVFLSVRCLQLICRNLLLFQLIAVLLDLIMASAEAKHLSLHAASPRNFAAAAESAEPPKRVGKWYFGGLASAAAACCTHPLDLLKVHLQTAGKEKLGIVSQTFSIIRSEGVLGMYSGLSASLVRQLTYSTTRFAIYEVRLILLPDLIREACIWAKFPFPRVKKLERQRRRMTSVLSLGARERSILMSGAAWVPREAFFHKVKALFQCFLNA